MSVDMLVAALKALGRPWDGGLCFCDVSIGNPMARGHSQACMDACMALATATQYGPGVLQDGTQPERMR